MGIQGLFQSHCMSVFRQLKTIQIALKQILLTVVLMAVEPVELIVNNIVNTSSGVICTLRLGG